MIRGEKITLRAMENRDLEILRRWRNHPDLMLYHFSTLPVSEAAQQHWYESRCADSANVTLIIENENHAAVGYTILKNIDHKNRNAEIGLHLDPEYQGKGYGKDAFKTLIRFCFQEMNLHRVFLQVLDFNERAYHLYERLGFTVEGHLREAYFTQNRYHDIIVMSLLESEFIE